ncbi:MAG: ACP S-malonyltransferase [Pirellulales bacterium]|nr:ACP S-malonyltransferase [Pirellulales bacterium]
MTKVALLFPGQGAQYVGMGKALAEKYVPAAALFTRASEVLGYDLLALCATGPAERLDSTAYSQPALFVVSLASLEALRVERPDALEQCVAAAGLSLGEYTALVFAGALDFEDGLRLVQERGAAMQAAADAVPSGMVSVLGLEQQRLAQLCAEEAQGEVLQIANLLCPGNVVVAGTKAACRRLARRAEESGGVKTVPLAVAGAFHTPLMEPAAARLRAALAAAAFRDARLPVVSNVDAQPHTAAHEFVDLLARQLTSMVRWEDSMRWLVREGCTQFFEVGPGRVLRGLLRRIDRGVRCDGTPGE